MDHFTDDMTLAEARDLLRTLVGKGHTCPCCAQYAKVYNRTITTQMAISLLEFRREAPQGEWGHAPTILHNKKRPIGDFPKLRYWGLIEEEKVRRPDGGRAGWWRITQDGEDFIAGRIGVPQYAHIYDGRRLSLSGDLVLFADALGTPFDYTELMNSNGQATLPL